MGGYTVYEILNTVNSDRYVGITSKGTLGRFKIHKSILNSKHSNTENRSEMYADMIKFGFDKFFILSIKDGLSKKLALKIEKELQKQPVYKRYAKRDVSRDRIVKFRSCYKLISEDETLFFKKTTDIAKHFKCHKTNVTRSLNDGYLFLKKYFVVRISEAEYLESNGQSSLF